MHPHQGIVDYGPTGPDWLTVSTSLKPVHEQSGSVPRHFFYTSYYHMFRTPLPYEPLVDQILNETTMNS